MSLPPTAPSYIKRALSDRDYLNVVFELLREREEIRQKAGSSALQGSSSRSSRRGWSSRLSGIFKSSDNQQRPNHLEERYRIEVGAHPDNEHHNRYFNIVPFDRTRVRVPAAVWCAANAGHGSSTAEATRDWEAESDYLNANWVRELHGGQWYVATQAPLRETAHAFLSLFLSPDARPPDALAPEIHQSGKKCRIRTAVQLTVSSEGGMTKAHPYFYSEVGKAFVIPPPPGSKAPHLEIKLESEEKISRARCVKSVLRLVPCRARPKPGTAKEQHVAAEEVGSPVRFTHLLFTHWPDFGVPKDEDKAALVEFARVVADTNHNSKHTSSEPDDSLYPDPPITINCSAGVGRTGTFIALSSLLRSHGLLTPDFTPTTPSDFPPLSPSPLGALLSELAEDEVAHEVDSLREQRPMMVQSTSQLLLIYGLLAAAFVEAGIRRPDSHSIPLE